MISLRFMELSGIEKRKAGTRTIEEESMKRDGRFGSWGEGPGCACLECLGV